MSNRLRSWGLVGVGMIAGLSISYGVTAYAFREAEHPIPVNQIREFTDVFGAIKADYVDPVSDRKLIDNAISGMVSGLDPHSEFLDADAYRELEVGTQGQFGGLGIEVGAEAGALKVIAPIDGTPAARAGVRAGDYIIRIDGRFTRGMSLNDAVKLMRGKPHTPITLTIIRKGVKDPLVIRIVRDIIHVQSVTGHMIEPGYGYVRISEFQDNTTADLARKIEAFYKEGPLKGLILDLRNDPGGVLNGAIGVSAIFLPPGSTVVTTKGRTADSDRRFVASPSDYLRDENTDPLVGLPKAVKDVPLVVLVNGASASASEIVSGALQDHKRAKILGNQTFGKGSVQSVIQLRGGSRPVALKLTTARYFTPSGRSIQVRGITPDYIVDDTPKGNFAGLTIHESDLTNHLANPISGRKAPQPLPKAETELAPANTHRYEFGSKNDFQLQQAINLLQNRPVDVAKAPPVIANATH